MSGESCTMRERPLSEEEASRGAPHDVPSKMAYFGVLEFETPQAAAPVLPAPLKATSNARVAVVEALVSSWMLGPQAAPLQMLTLTCPALSRQPIMSRLLVESAPRWTQ